MAMHHALNYHVCAVHPIIDSVHLVIAHVKPEWPLRERHHSWTVIDHVLWIYFLFLFFFNVVIVRIRINRLLHPLLHKRRIGSKHTKVNVFTKWHTNKCSSNLNTQCVALFWLTIAFLIPHSILPAPFCKGYEREARLRWFGLIQMRNIEYRIIKKDAGRQIMDWL